MPPKARINRENIIDTAIEITRKQGAEAINARSIASVLNCSTQPVFSNFSSMQELRIAVIKRANEIYTEYLKAQTKDCDIPFYKQNGLAYIGFAAEEKELFKLLYMRSYADSPLPEQNENFDNMLSVVQQNTGLDDQTAKLFHLEMWVFVHGIATMFATNFLNLDRELVSKMLTDAYMGLRKQYGLEV